LHWVMVTRAKIDLSSDGHSATLTSNGKTLKADLLEPASAKFHIGSTKPPTSEENQNEGTAVLGIDLNPVPDGNISRLAVLLTPVGPKWARSNPPPLKSLDNWQ
jgi:hypothetical protein